MLAKNKVWEIRCSICGYYAYIPIEDEDENDHARCPFRPPFCPICHPMTREDLDYHKNSPWTWDEKEIEKCPACEKSSWRYHTKPTKGLIRGK